MHAGRLAMDGLLLAILTGGTVTDIRKGKVHNALTYTGAGAGLLLNAVLRPAGLGLGVALGGLATGFFPLFLVYLAGGLGGGDVKLMAAAGAFLGPWRALYALLYTCIAGAALAIGLLIWKEGPGGAALRAMVWLKKPRGEQSAGPPQRFPFALAILLGTAWVLAESHLGSSLLDLLAG